MQLFLVLLHKITHFERIGKMIRGQFSFYSNLYGIFGDFAHKIAEAGSLLRQYEKLVIKSEFGIGAVFVGSRVGILHPPNNNQNHAERHQLDELPPSAVSGVVQAA